MNKEVLIQGFNEFLEGGLEEENKRRYRLATTAYFKAISQVVDLIVLKRTGFIPKNHTERFRLVEKHDSRLYRRLDNAFKLYRDTYTSPLNRETCKEVRDAIPEIIRFGELEKEFGQALEKIRSAAK